MARAVGSTRDIETLRLVYADCVNERNRLRDARRGVTSRLGPLPASIGVIVALFAALGPELERWWTRLLFGLALVPLALVIVLSARAIRERSYRELVAETEADRAGPKHDSLGEKDWLELMIGFEREMFPTLEAHFEQERKNLLRVEALLGIEVLLVVIITVLESAVG